MYLMGNKNVFFYLNTLQNFLLTLVRLRCHRSLLEGKWPFHRDTLGLKAFI